MIAYASRTTNRRNLAAVRQRGWRVLITPDNPKPPDGLRFAIDNGAWSAYAQGRPFDEVRFGRLIERYGALADFIVVPDIVAGGERSLEFSLTWMPRLRGLRQLLLALQDGMTAAQAGDVLRKYPGTGLFLGGTTEWKLKTIWQWGAVASAARCHYHVGRVNTARRIRLSAEAGADSFDGSSVSRYADTMPLLDSARAQPSLLIPFVLHGS